MAVEFCEDTPGTTSSPESFKLGCVAINKIRRLITHCSGFRKLAIIRCGWPHVSQKPPEVKRTSPSSCVTGFQHQEMHASVRHCWVSLEQNRRKNIACQHFRLRHRSKTNTASSFCSTAESQCGWRKIWVLEHCPKCFDTCSEARVSPTGTLPIES